MGVSSINFKRIEVPIVAALVLLLLGLLITFSPKAGAWAYGCRASIGIWAPDTSYCVKLWGTSTYVDYVSGEFRGSAEVCNSYVTAEFFDSNWKWYQTYKSSKTTACVGGAYKKINIKAYKKVGWMCSTLHYTVPLSSKDRTASVCHQIKK